MVYNLGKSNSLLNYFVSELRDENVQKDRMRFRKNLERIGEVMAYEISKKLKYEKKKITTPLGIASVSVPREQPVVSTILRAGLPLHRGILNYFDRADNGFISAYRKHKKDGSFEIKVEYLSAPDINGRILILADPMLASAQSMVLAYKAILQRGTPSQVHLVSIIASKQGLAYLKTHLSPKINIWIAALDEELTVQSYIVPGLGDAGDLAFGDKI